MSRINHNISSLQAMNRLNSNQLNLGTSLERLSSGLRINRGKDDPAGLIASENLRSEIQGINSAMANSTRANNVISTAEGALNEVSALLVQIRGLVTTSANTGGLADEERQANQLQVDSILQSIDRISNTTQFNGKKLLDGSLEYTTAGISNSALDEVRLYSARPPVTGSLPITIQVTQSAQVARLKFSGAAISTAPAFIRITGNKGSEVLSFNPGTHTSAIAVTVNSFRDMLGISATLSVTNGAVYFDSITYGTSAFVRVESLNAAAQYPFKTSGVWPASAANTSNTDYGADAKLKINGQDATVDGLHAVVKNDSIDVEVLLNSNFGKKTTGGVATNGVTSFTVTGGGAVFQLSQTVNRQGQASVGILSVSTGTLGNHAVGYLNSLGTGNTNSISSHDGVAAQSIVDRAITQVSVMRGRLGAFQKNTIDTNVNSLNVALENVTSSESAIRDTDFAQETANMTRAQILVQATTTVLKTANSAPQAVLSLLQ